MVRRSTKNGMVPPACEKMNLMSLQRVAVPVNSRLVMVRVVSVANSMVEPGTPSCKLPQHLGLDGWV